jgi:hypothetical protein
MDPFEGRDLIYFTLGLKRKASGTAPTDSQEGRKRPHPEEDSTHEQSFEGAEPLFEELRDDVGSNYFHR